MSMPTILEVMEDPKIFGNEFRGPSWRVWRVCLAGIFGLPVADDDLKFWTKFTGRTDPPTMQTLLAYLICGRRSGKTRIAALIAVYVSVFREYKLSAGELGVVLVISRNLKQTRVVFGYISALLDFPALRKMVIRKADGIIEIQNLAGNHIRIEIAPPDFRSVRGYTLCAAILDELAYYPQEGAARPDSELLAALLPALATVPNALLVAISTPFRKSGELWKAFNEYWGKDDAPALVWRAKTRQMNPHVSKAFVLAQYLRDRVSAASEFGAEFREDAGSFFDQNAIAACVTKGLFERPYIPGVKYFAATDPSGASSDSYTLAICHLENGRGVLDCLREKRPPFSPDGVTADFCQELKRYNVYQVTGDRYSGEWCREAFRKHGVNYKVAEFDRSKIYLELFAYINSGQVDLLDHPILLRQLAGLERRTTMFGRERIDHRTASHDDVSNCAGLALVTALIGSGSNKLTLWQFWIDKADEFLKTGITPEQQIENEFARLSPAKLQEPIRQKLPANTSTCPECGFAPLVRRDSAVDPLLHCNRCSAEFGVTLSRGGPVDPATANGFNCDTKNATVERWKREEAQRIARARSIPSPRLELPTRRGR